MPSKKDKMDALKKMKEKGGDEEKDKALEEGGDEVEAAPEGEGEDAGPDMSDPMDLSGPGDAAGEPGGAAEGVDEPAADVAEGLAPETDVEGSAGSIVAETLGVSPDAGRRLYEAAIEIPAYEGMSEDDIAKMLDSDMNARMRVEMMAAKRQMSQGAADMDAPEGDMGAPTDESGAMMDEMGGAPGGMAL